MSVEWDEELIAGLESGLHNCGSDECQERQRAVRLARAEHTARLEAEAQARHLAVENGRTAARMMMAEAERDALAEKVSRAKEVLRDKEPGTWIAEETGILGPRAVLQFVFNDLDKAFAILSDGEGR